MTLRTLLKIHTFISGMAGLVLIMYPGFIPSLIGLTLPPSLNIIVYLLASAELGIAVISYKIREVTDKKALRAVVLGFIVLHSATAIFELVVVFQGIVSPFLLGNMVLRILAVGLFVYYGLY